jgi:hypothetical protein
MRGAFDVPHIGSFLIGVLSGRTSTGAVPSFGAIAAAEPWDGQDGVPPEEEPLDLDDVELDG